MSLSDFSWTPVLLESNYNTIQINQQLVEFNNGVKFNISPLFAEIKDVTINNNSFLMLSKHLPVKTIFKEKTLPSNKLSLKNTALKVLKTIPEVTTIEFTKDFFTNTTIENIKINSPESYKYVYLSTRENKFNNINKTTFLKSELFDLIFIEDYVMIKDLNGSYLGDGGDYIYVSDKGSKFNYILNDVSLILFKVDSNFTRVLTYDHITDNYIFVTLSEGEDVPESSIFYIEHYENYLNSSSLTNSYFSKYHTDPLSAVNSIEIDQATKNVQYNQNYLINIPLHNEYKKYTAYINSLKNYQTPDCNYSIINNSPERRNYTSIFTGNNQKHGYDNIYLNYTSSTLEKVFKKNTSTVFHCPATLPAEGIPLSSAGLFEDGAIAGKNPYTSDRISYNRRDYRELGIPQVSSVIADNTWLYAWLSATDVGDPVWVDRFYTGAQFDITGHGYIPHDENSPLIVDVPSTMMLLPHRIYEYFHQGKETIKTYIDAFNNIDRNQNTTLLKIEDWSSINLVDMSSYKNHGSLSLDTKTLCAEYLQLNGKNYALFPATTINDFQQLTISFWYNVPNWREIEGTQIIGNYSDGGIGLFNRQTNPTAFITVYDNLNGYIYNYNSNFKIINEQVVTDSNNTSVYIMRTTDQNYWLIQKINNKIYATKYDLNNNAVVPLVELRGIQYISQVEFDALENIYVYDSINTTIVAFNGYTGAFVGRKTLNEYYKRIEVIQYYTGNRPVVFSNSESKSFVVGIDAHASVVDNDKNIWSVIGVNLYKNLDFYATIGNVIQLTCDGNNDIWVLHDTDKITKFNSAENNIQFSLKINSTIFDTSKTTQTRFINFISIKNIKLNKDTPYAVVIDNQEKVGYIIDMEGNVESKLNLLAIPSTFLSKRNFDRTSINFTAYGDFTGYQYQRKFNTSNELAWRVTTTQGANTTKNLDTKYFDLPFSTENFSPGWHHFAFVFDYFKGDIVAYVDGNIVNRESFTPYTYKIKQSFRPLSIGAMTTEQGILNDTVGINILHKTIGKISHLHVYKYAFDKYDINSLFRGTYIDTYRDMTWNITVGQRNYIEQIERFFMHKMPGNKSKHFNIKIKNFAANLEQQALIEQAIRSTIYKITPADTTLHKIKWA